METLLPDPEADDIAAALEEVARAKERLIAAQQAKLRAEYSWRDKARPEQLPPEGRWRTWYVRGGRGSGKTWTAAHLLAEWIVNDPEPGEWGIISPTYPDAWSVAVEGESGFLAALGTNAEEVRNGNSKLVEHWHRSFAEIKLRSGHIVRVASAQDGGLRIQGKNLKGAWCDEIGLWDQWETTWDESLKFAVRKGMARIIATGTPKKSRNARKLVRRLLEDPSVPVTRLRTMDNAANLAQEFLDEVVGKSKGTLLERQELEGELLDDIEGALWSAEVIDAARIGPNDVPDLVRVVVAIDPAVTSKSGSDETGIIVAGEDGNGHGYVLADYSMRGSPDACMKKAVWAYQHHKADRVIGEANNGGDYLEALLRTVDPDVAFRKVIASRGKAVRAEPASALYEQKRVHHAGVFDDLEDQLTTWTPLDKDSPDRLDALVWSLAGLKGLSAGSWMQAYRVITCEGCGHQYSSMAPHCPRCKAERPAGEDGEERDGGKEQPRGEWAIAYGIQRCPEGHSWSERRYSECPQCNPHSAARAVQRFRQQRSQR